MKKTYIKPVSKVAEFDEEALIATSLNYGPEDEKATEGGEDAKRFIDFSEDIEW